MIDYKEFCFRFWLAADDSEQEKTGIILSADRFAFARSMFLDTSYAEGESEVEIVEAGLSRETNTTAGNTSSRSQLILSDDNRPLGELRVTSAELWPKELETGTWPDDYSLSDHGMVVCTFTAKLTN